MPSSHLSSVLAFVALGSNLGDRHAHLTRAVEVLRGHPRVRLATASPVYESAAHTLAGAAPQPAFLNAVIGVETTLPPHALLTLLHTLEHDAGRRRSSEGRWQARTLDLDVLLYGTETVDAADLVVPHPRLGERRFVLRPLADLAPNLVVPSPYHATVADLLARCPDAGPVRRTGLSLLP